MNTEPRRPVKARHLRARDEASNSFALFVFLLPVIMGAFGMGLDMSRNVYIRSTLQNGLDMATVSGAGVTSVNAEGDVDIDNAEALRVVEKVYALNRQQVGGLDCWGQETRLEGTTLPKCWKNYGTATVQRAYLTYGVRERSRNAFLPVIGVPWQEYNIVSHARVAADTR